MVPIVIITNIVTVWISMYLVKNIIIFDFVIYQFLRAFEEIL